MENLWYCRLIVENYDKLKSGIVGQRVIGLALNLIHNLFRRHLSSLFKHGIDVFKIQLIPILICMVWISALNCEILTSGDLQGKICSAITLIGTLPRKSTWALNVQFSEKTTMVPFISM